MTETQLKENCRAILNALLDEKTVYANGVRVVAATVRNGRLVGFFDRDDRLADFDDPLDPRIEPRSIFSASDLTNVEVAVWTRGDVLHSPNALETTPEFSAPTNAAPEIAPEIVDEKSTTVSIL